MNPRQSAVLALYNVLVFRLPCQWDSEDKGEATSSCWTWSGELSGLGLGCAVLCWERDWENAFPLHVQPGQQIYNGKPKTKTSRT